MKTKTEKFQKYLDKLGINQLNPMQEAMVDTVLRRKNILLLSPTGSGKTLAFLLPLIKIIDLQKSSTQGLIISPTRELAIQIHSVLKKLSSGIRILLCYGGHSMREEKKSMSNIPQIIIGTPGRIHDHLRKGNLVLNELEVVVLDEFDKSLELGFHDDMKAILQNANVIQQYLLTSATDSVSIPDFLGIKIPTKLNFITEKRQSGKLNLWKVISPAKDKLDTLLDLISDLGETSSLIFLNYRDAVDRVYMRLADLGIEAGYFHGGLEQKDREVTLLLFRNGSNRILVTTDLSARGLDIPLVRNVIHYQLPDKEEQFIHRNGRTARMEATGNAFVLTSEYEKLKEYIPSDIKIYGIGKKKTAPPPPPMVTIEFNRGKRDKINKIDILGFLTKQGQLLGNDVGLIEIKKFNSFAAIDRTKAKRVIQNLKEKKIKGKSVKVHIIRN
ncbi:MAG: DEAD/DEAH box helicase [Bacteroidia bacterium]|nr:DEAD/DEAH box helicase [Bacteroidia bacterium]